MIIVCSATLGPEHCSTGHTVHHRHGQVVPLPTTLQIVQLCESNGYYLIHLDSCGHELTDTYHETVEDAKKQADFEFSIKESDWMGE